MKDKWIELIKWFIGSVVIVIVTLVIDTGFKEREAGIKEMEVYDKYVEIILNADNIEQRWKLCEYFSIVTPTERLRKRWQAYKDTISPDYYKWKKVKLQIDTLYIESTNELNDSPLMTVENVSNIKHIEQMAFNSLLQRDYTSSVDWLTKAENEKPGYHNCYEILKYLKSNKDLQDTNSSKWSQFFDIIINKWSWEMSDIYKDLSLIHI